MQRTPETIVIPGKPVGKARPRVGAGGHFFSPKVGAFEATVIHLAQAAWGTTPDDALYQVHIGVQMKTAESWSKNKTLAVVGKFASATPDLANVESACHDALKGIIYDDDRQIVMSSSSRRYGPHDQVTITVREVGKGIEHWKEQDA